MQIFAGIRLELTSLPSRGAWIEIENTGKGVPKVTVAPLTQVWIETTSIERAAINYGIKSLPSRGAWIEIYLGCLPRLAVVVVLPSRGAWIEIES